MRAGLPIARFAMAGVRDELPNGSSEMPRVVSHREISHAVEVGVRPLYRFGVPTMQVHNLRFRAAAVAVMLSIPGALYAQASPASAGATSRVVAADLSVHTPPLPSFAVPLLVERPGLEPSRQAPRGGALSFTVRGGLIGAGIGLLTGHVIKSTWRDAACTGPGCEPPTDFSAVTAYVYLPLAGAGFGALIGTVIGRSSSWVPVVSPGIGSPRTTTLEWILHTR